MDFSMQLRWLDLTRKNAPNQFIIFGTVIVAFDSTNNRKLTSYN